MKTEAWSGTPWNAVRMTGLLLSLVAGGVAAQDGVSVSGDYMSYAVPDYGSVALSQSILESMIDDESRDDRDAEGSARPRAGAKAAVEWSVTYDPAISDSVRREYLANIERLIGRERAQAIGEHLRGQPASRQFDALARPYGLSRSSLADVVTGYLVLMWATANRAPEPTLAQVQGLKQQVLSSSGAGIDVPRSSDGRQRVAESLLYRVSQVATQREIADRRGDERLMRAIADNANDSVKRSQGIDLRRMQLTSAGLERRSD